MSRNRWLLVLVVGFLCAFLFWPCIVTIRDGESWVLTTGSIRQVGIAIQNYHDTFGQLPPAVVRDKEGQPLYSWRVAILPFLEQNALYQKFRLDEPWDSPHNKPLSLTTPRCYLPYYAGRDKDGLTRYQVLVGPGTAFERPGLTWNDFPDGLGSTVLVVESGDPVPWSKPVDLNYDLAGPLPPLGSGYTKPVHFFCREVARRPGFAVCFGDGTGRFVQSSTDERILRALITRNGGESVDVAGLK